MCEPVLQGSVSGGCVIHPACFTVKQSRLSHTLVVSPHDPPKRFIWVPSVHTHHPATNILLNAVPTLRKEAILVVKSPLVLFGFYMVSFRNVLRTVLLLKRFAGEGWVEFVKVHSCSVTSLLSPHSFPKRSWPIFIQRTSTTSWTPKTQWESPKRASLLS